MEDQKTPGTKNAQMAMSASNPKLPVIVSHLENKMDHFGIKLRKNIGNKQVKASNKRRATSPPHEREY